ncbi:hypothetical protein I4U23_027559 [Adineta vaga]|nr:hypothetical protein I4U23_027559 [Adineta vaga]
MFTAYGIHPKYIPFTPERALEQLGNIFENKFNFEYKQGRSPQLKISVVLHDGRKNSFQIINLNVISNFLNYFNNSFIGLNGSITTQDDLESQKLFSTRLIGETNIVDQIIIETDFPFLRPLVLEPHQYSPVSGITTTAQFIMNIY